MLVGAEGLSRLDAQASTVPVPILLGFPDGKLGDYAADRGLIYRVADRVGGELQRLRPAMNPQRGAPALVVPQASYFTTRISFAREDFRVRIPGRSSR